MGSCQCGKENWGTTSYCVGCAEKRTECEKTKDAGSDASGSATTSSTRSAQLPSSQDRKEDTTEHKRRCQCWFPLKQESSKCMNCASEIDLKAVHEFRLTIGKAIGKRHYALYSAVFFLFGGVTLYYFLPTGNSEDGSQSSSQRKKQGNGR